MAPSLSRERYFSKRQAEFRGVGYLHDGSFAILEEMFEPDPISRDSRAGCVYSSGQAATRPSTALPSGPVRRTSTSSDGAPGTRVPSRNWRRWQLVQFGNVRATPSFVGTQRMFVAVPSGRTPAPVVCAQVHVVGLLKYDSPCVYPVGLRLQFFRFDQWLWPDLCRRDQ